MTEREPREAPFGMRWRLMCVSRLTCNRKRCEDSRKIHLDYYYCSFLQLDSLTKNAMHYKHNAKYT